MKYSFNGDTVFVAYAEDTEEAIKLIQHHKGSDWREHYGDPYAVNTYKDVRKELGLE